MRHMQISRAITTIDEQAAARRAAMGWRAEFKAYPKRVVAALVALALMLAVVAAAWCRGEPGIVALACLGAALAFAMARSGRWVGALGQALLRSRGHYLRAALRAIARAETTSARRLVRRDAAIASNLIELAETRAAAVAAAVIERLGHVSPMLSARLAPAPRSAATSAA